MGFIHVYMGLYGGGTAAVVVVPDMPGIEYAIPATNRMHYAATADRLHYAIPDLARLHYEVREP